MRTWFVTSSLILVGSALFAACGGGGSPSGSGGAGAGSGGAPSGPGSGAGTQSGGGGPDPGVGGGPIVAKQPLSPDVIVDQFGYRPSAEKIAVLKSPVEGFDAAMGAFTPGAKYAVVDAHTGKKVFEGAPTPWNGGAEDASSGDKAWWFDFSSVKTEGAYFVLDEPAMVRSDVFVISSSVYSDVLIQASRMFYYQREGIKKDAAHAGAAWADAVAHPQDATCGLYSDGSAPHDLKGGWFDAGDQNEYTNWGASDSIELLRAYTETPTAFGDQSNIPESGNGVPDILDEVKWELDWMTRMQDATGDGSVLSIKGHTGASPPSSDHDPCKYGPPNTSATLTTAAAFAFASKVFAAIPAAETAYPGYAADLQARAGKAWTWADAHPSVTFSNSGNVGAGEQEVDDNGRILKKLQAAVFLFELTGTAKYQTYFDQNYTNANLIKGNWADPADIEAIDTLLEYTRATGATSAVVADIKSHFQSAMAMYFSDLAANSDPYLAHLAQYYWGSNQIKATQGSLFYDYLVFSIDGTMDADAARGAERYVHYVNGVNPLALVYLSNMADFGANTSVTSFYHSWFSPGSDWSDVTTSKYGPPPGYLPGGPNPSYSWDGCCPSGCGSAQNNAACGAAPLSPPANQPPQKSYKNFNDGWPLDSWSVTEPDDGYQAHFVRLLSKFAK
jgi:endoglucanase